MKRPLGIALVLAGVILVGGAGFARHPIRGAAG